MDYKLTYKKEIASFLNCKEDEVILTWKGRVSLYGILQSLNLEENDEIIIPSFTCVVVPNAIIYNKLKPIYVDVNPLSYNIDISKIEAKITSKTKAILAQNTFGLSSDIDAINDIAKKYNLFVIEDCTHGFGGSYKSKLNGTHADATFFSSQWNKMFSTAIGGFAIIKHPKLKKRMNAFEDTLEKPSKKEELILRLQLFAKKLLGYKALYWRALKLYRFLSEKNIVIGSSSGGELSSVRMPNGYLQALSDVQCKKGAYEVKHINKNINHRKNLAKFYDDLLESLGKQKVYAPDFAEHTYTKYVILVKDRDFIFKEAVKHKIPIHNWFVSQIHPVQDDFEKWFLNSNEFPVSKKLANHIINLPTDLSVNNSLKNRVGKFLESYKDQIVSYKDL